MGDFPQESNPAKASSKTLISHPKTGEPVEVDVDENGAAIMPEDE